MSPLLLCCTVPLFAALDAGAWPMIRYDAQNTAATAAVGRLSAAPRVVARYSLGGSPAGGGLESTGYVAPETVHIPADLDGDACDEIITVAGGPVRAFRGDGEELWLRVLGRGQPYLLGAADLDGCGTPEVVCSTGLPATIHILSGQDGRLLWEHSFDEQVYFAQGTRIADLDGDGVPELFILGNAPAENSGRVGWAYSFRDGYASPRQLWGGMKLPFNPHYRPQTVVADIDGDGSPEIVIASAVHAGGIGLMVAALDGRTGAVKRTVAFSNGDRNYGHLQAIRSGDKPQLDILVIGMLGRSHITYLANDDVGMREVWHFNGTFQVPYNPVADIDGDGRLEVAYTRLGNEGPGSRPEDVVLTVCDLASGELERELPGMRLQGIVSPRDGDAPILIATTVPDGRIVIGPGSAAPRELLIPNARLCLAAPQSPLNMMNEVLADRSGHTALVFDADGDGVRELLVSTPDVLRAVSLADGSARPALPFRHGAPLTAMGALRARPGSRDSLLLGGEEGLVIWTPGRDESAHIALHNLPPRVPIVAPPSPGGGAMVLVSPSNRHLAALDGRSLASGKVRELWVRHEFGGFEAPTVSDLDGDGKPEILACDRRSAEPVVLNAQDRVTKRLPALPTDGTPLVTGTCVVGRFGDGSHPMVGAVSGVGPNDGAAKWTALDPADVRALWQREGGPHPRRTPAVWDANGDGVDDLLYSHYFDLCIADGRTGQYLAYTPDVVPGYHLASVADLDGGGTRSLLLSGGYMGIYRFDLSSKELWRIPGLDYNAGGAAAVADVDGDGAPELGVAFTDRFSCFDARTGALKWQLPLPGRCSDTVAADIDGDGRPEFLFGCVSGDLYAVKAQPGGAEGSVLWQVSLGAPLGQPVVADIDGDGWAEVLVCTQDGWLYVLS